MNAVPFQLVIQWVWIAPQEGQAERHCGKTGTQDGKQHTMGKGNETPRPSIAYRPWLHWKHINRIFPFAGKTFLDSVPAAQRPCSRSRYSGRGLC